MRFLNRLAAALLALVALMILAATLQLTPIPAWEDPLVRRAIVIVSLPMVAFFIALQALRLRTASGGAGSTGTIAAPPEPIVTPPEEREAGSSTFEARKEAQKVAPETVTKLGARTAFAISLLLSVPLAILMARFAVSLFAPWFANSLFSPWRTESRDVISWMLPNLGMLIGSLLTHRLIFRDTLRRTSPEVAMLTAILLTPMITFAISYQACWLWLRLYSE